MGKQDDFFRTQIRIPTSIHLALKDAAEESGRSMNAEIVARLEQSFSRPSGLLMPENSDALEAIDRLRAELHQQQERLRSEIIQMVRDEKTKE